jgi:hypothetical protein
MSVIVEEDELEELQLSVIIIMTQRLQLSVAVAASALKELVAKRKTQAAQVAKIESARKNAKHASDYLLKGYRHFRLGVEFLLLGRKADILLEEFDKKSEEERISRLATKKEKLRKRSQQSRVIEDIDNADDDDNNLTMNGEESAPLNEVFQAVQKKQRT